MQKSMVKLGPSRLHQTKLTAHKYKAFYCAICNKNYLVPFHLYRKIAKPTGETTERLGMISKVWSPTNTCFWFKCTSTLLWHCSHVNAIEHLWLPKPMLNRSMLPYCVSRPQWIDVHMRNDFSDVTGVCRKVCHWQWPSNRIPCLLANQ